MRQLAERPRAVRYDLSVLLVFRPAGEAKWRTALTENVSRSGVLFTAALRAPPVGTRIAFALRLPGAELHGGAWVRCEGRVVRHGVAAAEAGCAIASTIDVYEFRTAAPDGTSVDVDS
jgi:hypothetical protein